MRNKGSETIRNSTVLNLDRMEEIEVEISSCVKLG